MGTSESKHRDSLFESYLRDFQISDISDPMLQHRSRFLYEFSLIGWSDPRMRLAVVKYYVMLHLFKDYDLATRKEELEKVPRFLLNEHNVQFLTLEIWNSPVEGVPGHKPLIDIIGGLPVVSYN